MNKCLARRNKSRTAKANKRQEKPCRQRHFGRVAKLREEVDVTDNWKPNERKHQPRSKGNVQYTKEMISLLHDLVTECTKCPECKIMKPLLIRAEHLLDREPIT
jgi:hypothetical protein